MWIYTQSYNELHTILLDIVWRLDISASLKQYVFSAILISVPSLLFDYIPIILQYSNWERLCAMRQGRCGIEIYFRNKAQLRKGQKAFIA